MARKLAVGIDLGTTHTALAQVYLDQPNQPAEVVPIPQLVQPGSLQVELLLPSFLYFAHASEADLSLPWDAQRRFAVGQLARARASEAGGRVISSAKSWLSHQGLDRRKAFLPLGAPEDIEKISPVEASFRYLDHLSEAFSHGHSGLSLADQEVVLTVPASFDAAARELTVEAAYAAGLTNLTLLEEPQAALYAWLASRGDRLGEELSPGEVVLVVDVGGGTTDFSVVVVEEREGRLDLARVAVGEHILLGGDNMDWALAHDVAAELESAGNKLDPWQFSSLVHACRHAKEQLLGQSAPESVPVVVPGRGSSLFAGALRATLRRERVEALLVDGFFEAVPLDAAPLGRARSGLTQIALPFASDPVITKHLASFLRRQRDALPSARAAPLLCPTSVLFNGGVFRSSAMRARLLDTLNGWLEQVGAPRARCLAGEDLDLAVAKGAAFYALARRGTGLRISGGTAQAYYVGLETPGPAVPGLGPRLSLLCVSPFGAEEGSVPQVLPDELAVVVGEPVVFRFFGSSVRRGDELGEALPDWEKSEVQELSPIEIAFPSQGREPGSLVPVRLAASITEVGTLLLEAVPLEPLHPNERFKVELSVRET